MTRLDERLSRAVDALALDRLFYQARTFREFQESAVDPGVLETIYDIAKWGATSANGEPARFVFLVSETAKARLRPGLPRLTFTQACQVL